MILKLYIMNSYFLFPSQEDSWAQPQVHMEEVDQFTQEMVVRN